MPEPAEPSIADRVTRLYESIAGFHVTHLLEIGRELSVASHHQQPRNHR